MKCIAKHKISPRISTDWSRLHNSLVYHEVHTKAEVVHPNPGHLGLGVIFTTQA